MNLKFSKFIFRYSVEYFGSKNGHKYNLLNQLSQIFHSEKNILFSNEHIHRGFTLIVLISQIHQSFFKKWYELSPTGGINKIIEILNIHHNSYRELKEALQLPSYISYEDLLSWDNQSIKMFIEINSLSHSRETILQLLSNKILNLKEDIAKYNSQIKINGSKIFRAFTKLKESKRLIKQDSRSLLNLYSNKFIGSDEELSYLYKKGNFIVSSYITEEDKFNPLSDHNFIVSDNITYELQVNPYSSAASEFIKYISKSDVNFSIRKEHIKSTKYYTAVHQTPAPMKKQLLDKILHLHNKYQCIYIFDDSYKDFVHKSVDDEIEYYKSNNFGYGYYYNCNTFIFNLLKRVIILHKDKYLEPIKKY